jgi:glycosyltransferase involved in cell wall biosynthesis
LREARTGSRRIRVIEVIATLDAAGAEREVALLATRLDRARFDVRVLALTRGGPLEANLRAAGVPVDVLGKRWKLSPAAVLGLAHRLRRARPDIVHTHLFTANAYGRVAALLAGAPAVVATEHATDPGKRRWHEAIDRALARRSAAVVCVSEAVRAAYARRGIPAAKLRVIPNGVDAEAIARAAEGLAPAPDLVATASRLDPAKDVPTLVRAIAILRARGAAARLAIAGEGPARAAIEAEIARAGLGDAVRLLGFRPDVPRVIAGASVFATASRTEGFGLAAAEAMAVGRPVVASRVEGLAEVVEDGRTGLLVPSGNAEAFALAIGALLADPARARAMGEAGRARVCERFPADRMVREWAALFDALCPAERTARCAESRA